MEVSTFTCSICGESSRDICVYCTKDACGNHLCDRCHRCSDCCACERLVFRPQNNGHPKTAQPHYAQAYESSHSPSVE